MPIRDRRNIEERRAGSRTKEMLRLEPLEDRQFLSTAAGTAPDLVAVGFQSATTGDWGSPLRIVGDVVNQGNADASGPFSVDVFVSVSPTPNLDAVKIDSISFPDGLGVGESFTIDQEVDLPALPLSGVGADGAIHLGLVVDASRDVAELNETNNLGQGTGHDSSLVLIVPKVQADPQPISFTLGQSTALWGDTVPLELTLENNTAGMAPGSIVRIMLTPVGAAPGTGFDVTLAGEIELPDVLPHQQLGPIQGTVTLPPGPPTDFPAAGEFVAWVVTDAENDINPQLRPLNLRGQGVDWTILGIAMDPSAPPDNPNAPKTDLAVADLLTPGTTLAWGSRFQVAATVSNPSEIDSPPLRARFLLGGPNGELNNALVLGFAELPEGLAAGASTTIHQELKLPGNIPGVNLGAGLGRIVLQVDPDNEVEELTASNNSAFSAPMTLGFQAPEPPGFGQSPAPTPNPEPAPQPTTPPTPPPTPSPSARAARIQEFQLRRQQLQETMRAALEERLAQMRIRRDQLRAGRPANPILRFNSGSSS